MVFSISPALVFTVSFQSMLPVRGATPLASIRAYSHGISIHAPRAGSDRLVLQICAAGTDFNPRSPCGERPTLTARLAMWQKFQSTLPVWGATNSAIITATARIISIHAPRVGSDLAVDVVHAHACRFQSTLPVWGATCTPCSNFLSYRNFNPRSPCGERHNLLIVSDM